MAYKWHAIPIDSIETQIRAVEASFTSNEMKLSARCFCNEVYKLADGYGLFDFSEIWTWLERLHINEEDVLNDIAAKAEKFKIIKSVTLSSGEMKYICVWWYGFIGDKPLPYEYEARLDLYERMSAPKMRKAETMERRRERASAAIEKAENDKKLENVATVLNNNNNTNIDIDTNTNNKTTTSSQNKQIQVISNPDESEEDQYEYNKNLNKVGEKKNNVGLNSRKQKYLRKSEFHLTNFFIKNAPRNFSDDPENLKVLVDLTRLCVKLGKNHKRATTECVTVELIAAIKKTAQEEKCYEFMPLEPKNVYRPQFIYSVFEKMQERIGRYWNQEVAGNLEKILQANLNADLIRYGGKLFPEWASAIAGTTPADQNWYEKYLEEIKQMQVEK